MVKIRMIAKIRIAMAGAPKAGIVVSPMLAGGRLLPSWLNPPLSRGLCCNTSRLESVPPGVRSRGERAEENDLPKMVLSHTAEPQFSQPVRQIVMMLIVLGLTAALAVLIFPAVQQIFLASPYLKIFILLVFVIGVLACFWQVLTLITSVNWIEGFAIDRPGHEFTKAAAAARAARGAALRAAGAALAHLDLDPLDPGVGRRRGSRSSAT